LKICNYSNVRSVTSLSFSLQSSTRVRPERLVSCIALRRLVVDVWIRPYGCALTSTVSTTSKPNLAVCSVLCAAFRRKNEAPIPAKHPQAEQEARLPFPHEHSRRPRCAQVPSPEGPSPPFGVIRSLSDRHSFQRLRASGVRCGRGPIRVVYYTVPGDLVRVAFAIPRSVGGAVVRNRIRRRIKAVLFELSTSDPGSVPGGDYLIRVTAPIDRFDHSALKATIESLLVTGSLR